MKWEYKVIDVKKNLSFWTGKTDLSELEYDLNSLGKQGWELVSVTGAAGHHGSRQAVAVLKRQA